MKRFVICVAVVFAGVAAFGQGATLRVLKRAEGVRDQNNARQEESPSAPSAKPNPAPPPRPDPVLAATLENIAALQADFAGLESDPLRKQPLVNEFNRAAHGAHPSKSSVSKLADDLAAALGGKHLSQDQLKKLAQDMHAIFNGSHLSPAQRQTVCEDVRKILEAGGALPDEASKIVDDLKTIALETG